MTVHEWMRIETHRKDEGPCRRESFHKGMKPRTIFLNNLLLTDPQSPSSSSQNYMTVWFHLLTSPLVITSCQIGFLYSALATSSGSDLKKTQNNNKNPKQKKNKTKEKQNSAPDCERLLHCAEFWSRACPCVQIHYWWYLHSNRQEWEGNDRLQSLQMQNFIRFILHQF